MKIRYQQLSASERDASHRGRWPGQSPAAIADNLGRSRSTVSCELARNGGVASYAAPAAQRRYQPGRRRGCRKRGPGTPLWQPVVDGPAARPLAAADPGRRNAMHPDESALRLSHESVYLALYALPRGQPRKERLAGLRQGRPARRPRGRGQDRRGRGAGGLHAQASGRPGLPQEDLDLRPGQGDGPAP
ncbi:hypothetical protein ELQ36_15485 [Methylococcus capsulatus]|nr:hypothetical protein [Methylococcus capsulatus]